MSLFHNNLDQILHHDQENSEETLSIAEDSFGHKNRNSLQAGDIELGDLELDQLDLADDFEGFEESRMIGEHGIDALQDEIDGLRIEDNDNFNEDFSNNNNEDSSNNMNHFQPNFADDDQNYHSLNTKDLDALDLGSFMQQDSHQYESFNQLDENMDMNQSEIDLVLGEEGLTRQYEEEENHGSLLSNLARNGEIMDQQDVPSYANSPNQYSVNEIGDFEPEVQRAHADQQYLNLNHNDRKSTSRNAASALVNNEQDTAEQAYYQSQIEDLKTQLLHSERDKQVQLLQQRKDLLGEKQRVLLEFSSELSQTVSENSALKARVDTLNRENESLRAELDRKSTDYDHVLNENSAFNNQIKKLMGESTSRSIMSSKSVQTLGLQDNSEEFILELVHIISPVVTLPSDTEPTKSSIKDSLVILTEHIISQSDRLKELVKSQQELMIKLNDYEEKALGISSSGSSHMDEFLHELGELLKPVVNLSISAKEFTKSSVKDAIKVIIQHIRKQSDRLKAGDVTKKELRCEIEELNTSNHALISSSAKLQQDVEQQRSMQQQPTRDQVKALTSTINSRFKQAYAESLDSFKKECLNKHTLVVKGLYAQIEKTRQSGLDDQVQLKKRYVANMKQMQAELRKKQDYEMEFIGHMKNHCLVCHRGCIDCLSLLQGLEN